MIEIYTDGSCSDNGEKKNFGGYGVVVTKGGEVVTTLKKSLVNTTNNRAEMLGVIHGITIAKDLINRGYPREIVIHTDSAYVQQMVTRWMFNWQRKGWKKSDGKTPENLDLVKVLFSLMQFERVVRIEKIEGHAGHKFNELADDLATEATKEAKKTGAKNNDG